MGHGYVGPAETDAILDATGSDWTGRRDHLLFLLLYTGARVSEIISLRVHDLVSSNHKQFQILGKGRKRRTIPLWRKTRTEVREWIKANKLGPDDPLLPNRWRDVLTRSGVAKQMKKAVVRASSHCSGLKGKTVSPHNFRHSTAMHMLESGVAVEVIALWLGHGSPTTTHGYVEASLGMKKQALERLKSPKSGQRQLFFPAGKIIVVLQKSKQKRFVPGDALLSFLENL